MELSLVSPLPLSLVVCLPVRNVPEPLLFVSDWVPSSTQFDFDFLLDLELLSFLNVPDLFGDLGDFFEDLGLLGDYPIFLSLSFLFGVCKFSLVSFKSVFPMFASLRDSIAGAAAPS
jgi:hypothetical protein